MNDPFTPDQATPMPGALFRLGGKFFPFPAGLILAQTRSVQKISNCLGPVCRSEEKYLTRILHFCIVGLTLLAGLPLTAATPPMFAWAKHGGAANADNTWGSGVSRDVSGNIYVVGTFKGTASFGLTNLTSYGGEDVFLAKYNPTGQLLWIQKGGGGSDDAGNAISVNSFGYVFVAGEFQNSATFGSTNLVSLGSVDVFLACYGPNGNLVWVRQYGGGKEDYAKALATDSAGNVCLGGAFKSDGAGASFGTTNLLNTGGSDFFLAKVDGAGTLGWVRQVGSTGSGDDYSINAVGVDGSQNVFVTGTYSSGFSGSDIFVGKFSSAGVLLWYSVAGSANGNVHTANGIAVDTGGNIFIAGALDGDATHPALFGGRSITNMGGKDLMVAKYDADGTNLWVQTAGTANGDHHVVNQISLDSLGHVYVTGAIEGDDNNPVNFGSGVLTNLGGTDIFVARYAPNGSNLWALQVGTVDGDHHSGKALLTDEFGNVFVTGTFKGDGNNPLVFGSTVLTNSGGTDMFIAKLRTPLPVVTLQGPNPLLVEAGSPWVDPGVMAVDGAGNTVSASVVRSGLVDASAPGTYIVTYSVTDAFGNTSLPVTRTITVLVTPTIAAQPPNQNPAVGSSFSINVSAVGTVPLSYQWRLNGVPIPNATNASFNIASFQTTNAGRYTVVISSSLGAVLSLPALVTPQINALAMGNQFSGQATLTAASGAGLANNYSASAESGEPAHDEIPANASMWISWLAPANGIATFRTGGSSFDTVLAIYSGDNVNSLVRVASDDDHGGYFTSAVTFNAEAGAIYRVAVDSASGERGNIVLTWSFSAVASRRRKSWCIRPAELCPMATAPFFPCKLSEEGAHVIDGSEMARTS